MLRNEGGTDTLAAFQSRARSRSRGPERCCRRRLSRRRSQAGVSPRTLEAYGRFLERTGRAVEARAFYKKLSTEASVAPIAAAGTCAARVPERIPSGSFRRRPKAPPRHLFGIAASLTDQTSADIAILYLQFALDLSPEFDLAKIVLADRLKRSRSSTKRSTSIAASSHDSPYGPAAEVQVGVDENRERQRKRNRHPISLPSPRRVRTMFPRGRRSATSIAPSENYPAAADAYDHAIKLLNPVPKDDGRSSLRARLPKNNRAIGIAPKPIWKWR